jgi:DNA-directed RNA polymerase specialized sigma24 family protein
MSRYTAGPAMSEETRRDLVTADNIYDEPHRYDRWEDELVTLTRIAGLTSHEAYALRRYYGEIPRNCEQIAGEMGMSRETARKRIDRAIEKIEKVIGRKIVL